MTSLQELQETVNQELRQHLLFQYQSLDERALNSWADDTMAWAEWADELASDIPDSWINESSGYLEEADGDLGRAKELMARDMLDDAEDKLRNDLGLTDTLTGSSAQDVVRAFARKYDLEQVAATQLHKLDDGNYIIYMTNIDDVLLVDSDGKILDQGGPSSWPQGVPVWSNPEPGLSW